MQIQISWLLQKPTDLDLHCLLKQVMSCSAREGLEISYKDSSNNPDDYNKVSQYIFSRTNKETIHLVISFYISLG